MLTELNDCRHLVNCDCNAELKAAPTGLDELLTLLHMVSAASWHTDPPVVTLMVGAPVKTTPNSEGNDQCRFDRGMNLPNPKLARKLGVCRCIPSTPVPFAGSAVEA